MMEVTPVSAPLSGVQGHAPAVSRHGCRAFDLAVGSAQECGSELGGHPTADPFRHAKRGNSCRWQQPPVTLKAALEAASL